MDPEKIRDWLRGPMVAVATPFKEDYSLDLDALQENIRFMIEGGVRTGDGGLLVAAAGGEHPTLNVEERKAIMTASIEAAQGEVPVLTSIQHTDYRVIVEMAQHAAKVGIGAAQLGPTYYYSATERDVLDLFQRVAASSDVSLMVYHTWWDGLHFSIDLLRKLADIETVRAVKWSSPDAGAFRDGLLALKDELAVVDNSGQHILNHVLGSRAFVTHLSSFWPAYPLKIWRLLEQGDYPAVRDALAEFKWPWMKWRSKVGAVTGGEGPFIKAAMEEVGLKAGPPRPPSCRPPEELLVELRDLLKSAGVPKAADQVTG